MRRLPTEKAEELLESGMLERVAGHVAAFFAAGHHRLRRHPTSGKWIRATPRARRVLELLGTI